MYMHDTYMYFDMIVNVYYVFSYHVGIIKWFIEFNIVYVNDWNHYWSLGK